MGLMFLYFNCRLQGNGLIYQRSNLEHEKENLEKKEEASCEQHQAVFLQVNLYMLEKNKK